MTQLPTILRTARAGSPARAWDLFVAGGWLDAVDDPKALTLKGRLLKDQAKAVSGAEQLRLFGEAAEAYHAAALVEPGSYPLINAATLAMLGGKLARSLELAGEVLAMLDANPLEAETPYWLVATRAEAQLLLGQEPEAQVAIADAIRKAPQAWEDHAATIGQFHLILSELGADAGWLERHRPPASLHFQGIMQLPADEAPLRAQVDKWLAQQNIGFGYGALAAGSDILIGESMLARNAELHVILPCDQASFRRHSVSPFGAGWEKRFDALIEVADTVDFLDAAQAPCEQAVQLCEATCMGLARQNARNLQSHAVALRIDRDAISGEARLAGWTASGGKTEIIVSSVAQDTGPPLAVEPQGMFAALLAVMQREDEPDIAAEGIIQKHHLSGITILQFDSLHAAWRAATQMAGDNRSMAIDQGFAAGDMLHSNLVLRIVSLAQVAGEDQLLASKAAALPLLAAHDDIRIEEAGEIRAAIGAFAAYAIISSS